MNAIDKAIRNTDFKSAKNFIGDEVVASCSGMISLLQSIRNKAAMIKMKIDYVKLMKV